MQAASRFNSRVRGTSSSPNSEKTSLLAPKVLVSTASEPAARYCSWICWTSSGRERTRRSTQFS